MSSAGTDGARSGSRFACVPANLYCYSGVFGGLQDLGLNMYDVRKKCDKAADKDGPVIPFVEPTVYRLLIAKAVLQGNGLDGDIHEQARSQEA